MDFVEDKVNKYNYIGERKNIFGIRGLDNPSTINQCLSDFDSFRLSGWFK